MSEHAPASVCILGATFGTDNLGLEALASGAADCAKRAFPDAEMFFLEYGREAPVFTYDSLYGPCHIPTVNIRFSKNPSQGNHIALLLVLSLLLRVLPGNALRRALLRRNATLRRLAEVDTALAISGGDSMADCYGFERAVYVMLPQILMLFLGRPLVLLPQTLGPFKNVLCRLAARWIMRRAKVVYSRERLSSSAKRILVGRGRKAAAIEFGADLGFVLRPARPPQDQWPHPPWAHTADMTLVGLNVSGLLLMGGYSRNNMFGLRSEYGPLMHSIIDLILKKSGTTVLLIPHVLGEEENQESDTLACREILRARPSRRHDRLRIIDERLNASQTKYAIGQCSFFIGSRMHACIAALSQHVPAAGLAYSGKFAGVFDTVKAGHLVADLRSMSSEKVLQHIDTEYKQRVSTRQHLKTILPAVREQTLSLLLASHPRYTPERIAV